VTLNTLTMNAQEFKEFIRYQPKGDSFREWSNGMSLAEVMDSCDKPEWIFWLAGRCSVNPYEVVRLVIDCVNTMQLDDKLLTAAVDHLNKLFSDDVTPGLSTIGYAKEVKKASIASEYRSESISNKSWAVYYALMCTLRTTNHRLHSDACTSIHHIYECGNKDELLSVSKKLWPLIEAKLNELNKG